MHTRFVRMVEVLRSGKLEELNGYRHFLDCFSERLPVAGSVPGQTWLQISVLLESISK